MVIGLSGTEIVITVDVNPNRMPRPRAFGFRIMVSIDG